MAQEKTRREIIEDFLLERFPQIKPFVPERDARIVERYKDGSFGISGLGFALYSNGHNLRGKSPSRPFGLIYEDERALFSIGAFRHGKSLADFLIITSPVGEHALERVREVTEAVLKNEELKYGGVYCRFLKLEQYIELLNSGFLPVKEYPFHPESPEEDETYTNSLIRIGELMSEEENGRVHIHLVEGQSRNSRKKARDTYRRFKNFLESNGLSYEMHRASALETQDARKLVEMHFQMLRERRKDIGSTPEDHQNSFEVTALNLSQVFSYIGYLDGKPVSCFIGELLSKNRAGLYTGFTLREIKAVEKLGVRARDYEGFTAMPLYAYLELFRNLRREGIDEVHMGGSETADLNRFKRQLGAQSVPTYWAVKIKSP